MIAISNNESCNNNTRNRKIFESEKVQLTLYLIAGYPFVTNVANVKEGRSVLNLSLKIFYVLAKLI